MISIRQNCSSAIASFALQHEARLKLPSDICPSVPEVLKLKGVPYKFYSVQRRWIEKDRYDLSSVKDEDIILVSDLFNFRSIDADALHGSRVFLDLAHCSMETVRWYRDIINHKKTAVLGIFLSFGKGKYYRFGGGGIGFTLDKIDSIDLPLALDYSHTGIPNEIVRQGFTSSTSTRVVLPEAKISNAEIVNLRSQGLSVSDSEMDQISGRRGTNYIVWKSVSAHDSIF